MPTISRRRAAVRFDRTAFALAGAAAVAACAVAPALAEERYKTPPEEIVRILDAPELPSVSVSPARDTLLLMHAASMPTIEEISRPMLRLAGLRIDPNTNGRHGPEPFVGLSFKRIADGHETPIATPQGASIGRASWSPDGSAIAFTVTSREGIELWVADASTGAARALTGPELNETLGSPFEWTPDGERLLCRFVRRNRGPAPEESSVPAGPVVQETSGRTAPVRTYQDLLENAHDEALLDYYLTSQLAFVDVESGRRTDLGEPAVYSGVDLSPDGRFVLVSRVHRPYSYLVPVYRFPEHVEVWDERGRLVARLAELPLRDEVPIEGVPTGPRDHEWRDNGGSELVWAEALDGGDPKNEADHRDRLMALGAPFDGSPREVLRTEHRYRGVSWLDLPGEGLVTEYDRDRRWIRTWRFSAAEGAGEPTIVFDRSIRERYNDPGRPVSTINAAGRSVVLTHKGDIFLAGRGATPEGDRPFLSRMSLATRDTSELWRNDGDVYEECVDVLTSDGLTVLTRRESPADPPNYYVRDLGRDGERRLTDFPDPHPQLRGIRRELVTYQRDDGVTLSATLYLPADYTEGERLPLLVWAYPMEFSDPSTAGQVTGSPNRFTRVRGSSHLFLLTQGYAIMDNAAMPVIGDPETMNDTFIAQIVGSAKAAIDKAASMGVADPDRACVGGHSYGAFMTANLLAHCDLFRAGLARSGAYNRTLTPFGFQAERRTLWEAPDIYFSISPFMHADKINEPLLMIHGDMDNNSGTFPIQSERMYHAVKGHGGTARLVMLPHESHGYRARESIMHTLAETIEWFDKHVKHASTPEIP